MMESEMISRNFKQIDTSKIVFYCHDRDNKTPDLMKNHNPNMVEKIDPNHGKKCFFTCWKKLINGGYHVLATAKNIAVNAGKSVVGFTGKQISKVKDAEYKSLFRSVKKHVQDWFNGILYDKELNNDEKKTKWKTIEKHIIGDHSRCSHENKKTFIWKKAVGNEQLQKDFHLFVDDLSNVFDKVDPNLTTNQNESLHAATSRLADKNTAWSKQGYEARVAYSYLHHNNPNECGLLIRQRNNVNINEIDLRHITQKNEKRQQVKIARSSPVYKKQESKRRQNYKKEMKSKPGDYFGVPLEQLKKECY